MRRLPIAPPAMGASVADDSVVADESAVEGDADSAAGLTLAPAFSAAPSGPGTNHTLSVPGSSILPPDGDRDSCGGEVGQSKLALANLNHPTTRCRCRAAAPWPPTAGMAAMPANIDHAEDVSHNAVEKQAPGAKGH